MHIDTDASGHPGGEEYRGKHVVARDGAVGAAAWRIGGGPGCRFGGERGRFLRRHRRNVCVCEGSPFRAPIGCVTVVCVSRTLSGRRAAPPARLQKLGVQKYSTKNVVTNRDSGRTVRPLQNLLQRNGDGCARAEAAKGGDSNSYRPRRSWTLQIQCVLLRPLRYAEVH